MKKEGYDSFDQGMLSIIQQLISAISVLMVGLILLTLTFVFNNEITSFLTPRPRPEVPDSSKEAVVLASSAESFYWTAPDIANISDQEKRAQINYGKQLIAHTAKYLGPKGSVKAISNGMNCQNCHLEAGTKIFGNNYGSVASTYPKFRARSGAEEDIYKRVNDCFERSLNGSGLAASRPILNFLEKKYPKVKKPRARD